MKFFLSYESAAPATFYLTKLEPLFSAKLAALEPKNYGDELTDIGIISIVLPEELLHNHPERQLFQRKSRSADIRLQMDFAASNVTICFYYTRFSCGCQRPAEPTATSSSPVIFCPCTNEKSMVS